MDLDVVADELAEPVQGDGDAIVAGYEKRDAIAAGLIRGGGCDDAGGDVENFDGGAGHRAAARVDDASLDRAARFLCERAR